MYTSTKPYQPDSYPFRKKIIKEFAIHNHFPNILRTTEDWMETRYIVCLVLYNMIFTSLQHVLFQFLLNKRIVSMSTLPNPGIPLIGTEIWKMYKITSDWTCYLVITEVWKRKPLWIEVEYVHLAFGKKISVGPMCSVESRGMTLMCE